jgi:hypothetical protein
MSNETSVPRTRPEEIGPVCVLTTDLKTRRSSEVSRVQWEGRYRVNPFRVMETNGSPKPKRWVSESVLDDLKMLLDRGIQGQVTVFRTNDGKLQFKSIQACLAAKDKIPW